MERTGSCKAPTFNSRDLTRAEHIEREIARVEYALEVLRTYPVLKVSDSYYWQLHGTLVDLRNLHRDLNWRTDI